NNNLDDPTYNVLNGGSGKNRTRWETGKTPLTQDAKLYVYDNFFNDPSEDMVTGPDDPPEFSSKNRRLYAEDKMDRPYVALEAKIKILKKDDSAGDAPDSVGEVPVAWEMDDLPNRSTQEVKITVRKPLKVATADIPPYTLNSSYHVTLA